MVYVSITTEVFDDLVNEFHGHTRADYGDCFTREAIFNRRSELNDKLS
jgi:hypothetical protein